MASVQVHRELDDQFLQCPICRKRFEDPKILSCFHTFCESCLLSTLQLESDKIECTLCRSEQKLSKGGVRSLPDNKFINDLSAFVNSKTSKCAATDQTEYCQGCKTIASGYCITCGDYLCDACGAVHKNMTVSKAHRIVTLQSEEYQTIFGGVSPFLRPIVCPMHPGNELKLYCETCKVPICLECALQEPIKDGGHKGHKNSHLKEAVEKRALGLRDLKSYVDRRSVKMKRTMETLHDVAERIMTERNDLGMDVHQYADQ
ncbi:E3 ubiquitin-protein ligase TRIM56-like [Saccoglossus kowalevskii]